jgi:NitT/TauT family transport system substrate-binding protein
MENTRRLVVRQSRRRLLKGLAGLGLSAGGLALLAGCSGPGRTSPAGAEPPPETTTIKIVQNPGICFAPQFVAEPLLRSEGFTDVQYVKSAGGLEGAKAVADGSAHLSLQTHVLLITRIDAGDPIVFLAGTHIGCFELFGTDAVRGIRDLKGKTVGVTDLGSGRHIFLASMAAYVGLDPNHDMQFITHPPAEAMQQLEDGTLDAFMAFPPEPQELRAKRVGHVVVNTALDRPWSQYYYCCMLAGNRAFVDERPVASKRAMRAILRAADICAAEPDRAAQLLVDGGYAPQLDVARQTLREIPYDKWRDYDPEDTVRFFTLRMHEIGMIKSTPDRIISQGTNWRFFNELKQELKV